MKDLIEFLKTMMFVIGFSFTLLVILPFSIAWLIARLMGL